MEYVVQLDDRGRLWIPSKLRRRLGLKPGSKVVLRIVKDHIELYSLSRMYESVSRIFNEKFRNWREEGHEASSYLELLVKKVENS